MVFVVVDGEAAGEAGAHARERIAIAPQQAHAEGVKGGKRGVGIKPHVRQQRGHALAHFAGGFIGESDGENRRRRHVALGDDVRDAMSDDASFSAARTGQDQQRAFRVAHRFSLLRVQPFKKIHGSSLFRSVARGAGKRGILQILDRMLL